MKIILIISVLIISVKCGLLDDLVTNEQKSSLTNLLGKKPKTTENEKTEYHQGVLVKVKETLENGTKIIIDALGNVIRINPKDDKEVPKAENSEPATNKPIKDAEIAKDDANKTVDKKPDVPSPNVTMEEAQKNSNETASKIEDELKNKTMPQKNDVNTKDGNKGVDDVKNSTEVNKVTDNDKLCTDEKSCNKVAVVTKMAFTGDECPTGKIRAADETCVDEE